MEIAGVVVQLVECISPSIGRRWKDHRGVQRYMDTLNQKLEDLYCRKRDIELSLATEVVKGETSMRNEVEKWLERVEKIKEEINSLEEKIGKGKFFSRANLGKNITRKIREAEELHRNCAFLDGLVIRLPRRGDVMPTITTLGGETSFKNKMEEIWEDLFDDKATKIGVCGMGGIGKTTALQHIHNRLLEDQKDTFDNVIWITVTKDSSVINLQEKIAKKLDLDISNVKDIAVELHAKLITKERYVLILDNLWEPYDITEIGIPEPTPENGCKLVVSTRSYDICRLMSCKPIAMELLTDGEALNLFLKIVGPGVLSVPNLEVTVKKVVEECARLPLAIVTIAGSLKDVVDVDEWEIALEELRDNTKESLSSGIFERLKFSYDRLGDKKLQDCLLYCALFPEDHPIERSFLIERLTAEGIIEERKTRESEIKKGQVMLNKLVNACLLIDATNGSLGRKYVKMHDLVRDMALQITSENPKFLVKSGVGLTSIPDEENWKDDLEKVSLMNNNIYSFPPSVIPPMCPRLSTLLLSNNDFASISNHFFLHMKGLSVLDLSGTGIMNLPDSMFGLVTLTTLFLRQCTRLAYVPSLAKLKQLRKLDLYETSINEVPQGLEMLVKLRYLNLDRCILLEAIPDGILGKLVNLQYLSLGHVLHGPKLKGEELACLRKLETFQGMLCDISSFRAYVRSFDQDGGPTSYLLQLGISWDYKETELDSKWRKIVHLTGNWWDLVSESSVATTTEWPLVLPKDLDSLRISYCCINTSSLFGQVIESFNLKTCIVSECYGIEHLFSHSSSKFPLLPSLEILELNLVFDLCGLIWGEGSGSFMSQLPSGSFSSLREFKMQYCNNVKKLFVFNIAALPNLEELRISGCKLLKEIISITSNEVEEEEDQNEDIARTRARAGADHPAIDIVMLPRLKILMLWDLPQLQSLPIVTDSLQRVQIEFCRKLKRLPFLDRETCPPSLQHVCINQDLWERLEWDHPNSKHAIQSIRVSNDEVSS